MYLGQHPREHPASLVPVRALRLQPALLLRRQVVTTTSLEGVDQRVFQLVTTLVSGQGTPPPGLLVKRSDKISTTATMTRTRTRIQASQ